MKLKVNFIDHTAGMKEYKAGDDVSHLSDEQKKFLVDNGHVESEAGEEASKGAKKSKASKGAKEGSGESDDK